MTAADDPRVWFITGCSSGLGRALAACALAQGRRAVVTARDVRTLDDLARSFPQTALALSLDVTDPAQREACVAAAARHFGRIDVLVNNAGYGYLTAVEEGEEERIRALFETNFFALAALTRLVLPGMRAQRRGHIVNITSIGGMLGNPGSGYYNATKFAVEGLSAALAREVAELGIHVTAVEPGPFRTDYAGRSLKRADRSIDDYASTVHARIAEIARNSGKQPGDPARAAAAIVKAVESVRPPANLVLGRIALKRLRARLEELSASLDEWEAVTLDADFPQP